MRFLRNLLAYAILLIIAAALMLWTSVGNEVLRRTWDQIRAGDLAGSYIGIPLTVLFGLALFIALRRPAFGRKHKAGR